MSTTVVNPGQEVSGQDDQQFQAFLRQAIQEEVAKAQQGNGNQPGTPPVQSPAAAPIKFEVNGQTYQYTTPEEASRAVQNLVNSFSAELNRVQQVQNLPQGAEVKGNEPDFDINAFVQKMTTNPVEAFDYVDKYRYGVDNPAQAVKDAIAAKQQLDEVNRVLAVYQFRDSHPEFNADGNPQAANAMYAIMQQNNLPFTAQGLEAAYGLGVMRGFFPSPHQPQQQQPAVQQPPAFPQNPYGGQPAVAQAPFLPGTPYAQTPQYPVLPPPGVPRGAQDIPTNVLEAVQDMSAEQIENILRRFQS